MINSRVTRRPFLLGLGALSLAACGADFDPASNVSSLRVLSVQADQPFAAPGETVRLQATSYDPEGRDVSWGWARCDNPASSSVEGCLAEILEAARTTGELPLLGSVPAGDSVEVTIPVGALDGVPPELRSGVLTGVLSVACPGTLALNLGPEPGADADGLLPFRCTDASGAVLGLHDVVVGLKRIYVRQTDRNQNPIIDAVTFDGEPWAEDDVKQVDSCDTDDFIYDDCKGEGEHHIGVSLSPGSFEAGTDELGRDFSEQLIVQYFSTEGIFEWGLRVGDDAQTGWVARRRASGQEIRLWIVARDDRGGVSLVERRVRVR